MCAQIDTFNFAVGEIGGVNFIDTFFLMIVNVDSSTIFPIYGGQQSIIFYYQSLIHCQAVLWISGASPASKLERGGTDSEFYRNT